MFTMDWCNPCEELKKFSWELEEQYINKIKFWLLHDSEGEMLEKYFITNFPTVIILRDSEEVERLKGIQPKELYKESIEYHLKNTIMEHDNNDPLYDISGL